MTSARVILFRSKYAQMRRAQLYRFVEEMISGFLHSVDKNRRLVQDSLLRSILPGYLRMIFYRRLAFPSHSSQSSLIPLIIHIFIL